MKHTESDPHHNIGTRKRTKPPGRLIAKFGKYTKKNGGGTNTVPQRYVPKHLSKKDKKTQKRGIVQSKAAYERGEYLLRKKVKSFKNKTSPHITKAAKLYKLDIIKPSKELSKKTKCNIKGLRKIFKKGQGAYYSSGSRPNQTPHSWAYARLASSISGGKAAGVDYGILEKYCSKKSKALQLAKKSMKKYNKGMKRVPQVPLTYSKNNNKTRKLS